MFVDVLDADFGRLAAVRAEVASVGEALRLEDMFIDALPFAGWQPDHDGSQWSRPASAHAMAPLVDLPPLETIASMAGIAPI